MDSATANDSNMGSFSSGSFQVDKRGGYYEVTVEARLSGNGYIAAGHNNGPATEKAYGSNTITLTSIVNASLGDTIEVMAQGDGASRTVYANYTRMKVVYLGS